MGEKTTSEEREMVDFYEVLASQGQPELGILYGYKRVERKWQIWRMFTLTAKESILRAARKSDEMLEPYEWKRSRTVLRRERASNRPDLADYASLIEAMGGEVIRIAAGSPDHINAMDMVEGYGDGDNPIIEKSEFVLSLFEQLDRNGIGPAQHSFIDHCTEDIYEEYQNGGEVPTLCALRKKPTEQDEPEARSLALALELFTDGSLDAFAHETNVDINNRMVVYDIMDLVKQLKTMGLLVITDAMLNRVTENWKKGKRTHIFLDEFHVVFENEHSGSFFNSAWRRFRKRNAFPTAITQNVEYLLDSVLASTMLSNSEYIVMLNQAASDRQKLAELLNISNEQKSYITNADAGYGLIKYGSSLVPFINKFPKDTRLYKLMTTKLGEDNANRRRMETGWQKKS